MVKWKLFGRSKTKDEDTTEKSISETDSEETIMKQNVEPENTENEFLAEHHETLQAGRSSSKYGKNTSNVSSDQRVWRDVKQIEDNIDNIHKIKARRPKTNLDVKVEEIISKKEKK